MLLRGTAKWAKVVGEPVFGYRNQYKEWSIDVYPDEHGLAKLEEEGVGHKIKDKGQGKYITFKRKELKADGKPNQPIRIVDHNGQPWDNRKIGNGSTVNVSFAVTEYAPGQKTVVILALQVWDYIEPTSGVRDEFETKGTEDWTTG